MNHPKETVIVTRLSTTTKFLIQSYVDSGRDLIDTDGIFNPPHFGGAIQSVQMCAAIYIYNNITQF